jgi:FUN14 family
LSGSSSDSWFLDWLCAETDNENTGRNSGSIFAALLYLESQHIVNVNWDKIQTISNGVLSAIATTATSNERYILRAIERYFGSNSSKNIDNKVAAVGDDSPLSKPDVPFDVALPTTIYL